MNVKLFIATPAFDGKVHVPYAISLSETVILCAKNHISVEYRIVTSGSLLCAERNRLIKSFLESDCTHMLCIDSDLGWPAQAVPAMLSKQKDFIAGCYPARTKEEKAFLFRPCLNEKGAIICDEKAGLLKMENIPAGFMILSRNLLQKMVDDNPDRNFTPKDPKYPSGCALFNTEIIDGEFWGEDYVFCSLARKSGFEIWVDPMIQFDHAGIIGMFAEILSNDPPENKN